MASLRNEVTKPIYAISGSSSGAIAATLYVYFSNDRIKEYADRFISDGGRAMHNLEQMVHDNRNTSVAINANNEHNNTSLHIATTRCSDGVLKQFDFPSKLSHDVSDKEYLLECLRASCKVPAHFHPSDVMQSRWPSVYPEEDGIIIDGKSYADGGISAPAPPTPLDNIEGACRVIISPISGGISYSNESNTIRISPQDRTLKFPIDIKCRGDFLVHASIQNLKALQISAGLATSIILQEWYDRGVDDGFRAMEHIK